MKSIKEKAKEYHRVIRVINKHSTIVDTQCSEMFVKGGNYVLEQIERIVNSAIENKSMTIPTWRLNYIIKQLKK